MKTIFRNRNQNVRMRREGSRVFIEQSKKNPDAGEMSSVLYSMFNKKARLVNISLHHFNPSLQTERRIEEYSAAIVFEAKNPIQKWSLGYVPSGSSPDQISRSNITSLILKTLDRDSDRSVRLLERFFETSSNGILKKHRVPLSCIYRIQFNI